MSYVAVETLLFATGAGLVFANLAKMDTLTSARSPLDEGERMNVQSDSWPSEYANYVYDATFNPNVVDVRGNMVGFQQQRRPNLSAGDPFLRMLYGRDKLEQRPRWRDPWSVYRVKQRIEAADTNGDAEVQDYWRKVEKRLPLE